MFNIISTFTLFPVLGFFFLSSIGAKARCGLWPVEQYPSILSYLPPTLSPSSHSQHLKISFFFPLLLSILSWVFLFISSLPVLE
jgi:sorbitol-specific phosphotransferase system component IIC